MDEFIVVCQTDAEEHEYDGERLPPRSYQLATRRVFPTRAEAVAYADTVNAARLPLVIAGRWRELRFV